MLVWGSSHRACVHQMVNTEIRLIILFAAKDGEALYSQQKQDEELTVAQIMNSLLPNSPRLARGGEEEEQTPLGEKAEKPRAYSLPSTLSPQGLSSPH